MHMRSAFALGEHECVDLGHNPVVVGPQRTENGPDLFELDVVIENILRGLLRIDQYWYYDVAVLLLRSFPHHPPDGLDDVDHRSLGTEEHDRIQSGDVDAFRETADICEDPGNVVGTPDPIEETVPHGGIHGTVDVLCLHDGGGMGYRCDPVEFGGQQSGIRYARCEYHGGFHRRSGYGVVAGHVLHHGIQTSPYAAVIAVLTFRKIPDHPCELRRNGLLVHREDDDTVVAQHVLVDGLSEGVSEELFAVDLLVIHREQYDRFGLRFGLSSLPIDAGGGGHVQTELSAYFGIVENIRVVVRWASSHTITLKSGMPILWASITHPSD